MARKPPGLSWESWVDRQVRDARERGEFDDLPGAGKPLAGLDQPHDDLWWVKQWMRREEIGVTPPTLAMRRRVELLLDALPSLRDEAVVRHRVEELNDAIRDLNRKATSGPPSTLMALDVERVVADWRARREPEVRSEAAAAPPRPSGDDARRMVFRRAPRGYRRRDVRALLDAVAEAVDGGASPAPLIDAARLGAGWGGYRVADVDEGLRRLRAT